MFYCRSCCVFKHQEHKMYLRLHYLQNKKPHLIPIPIPKTNNDRPRPWTNDKQYPWRQHKGNVCAMYLTRTNSMDVEEEDLKTRAEANWTAHLITRCSKRRFSYAEKRVKWVKFRPVMVADAEAVMQMCKCVLLQLYEYVSYKAGNVMTKYLFDVLLWLTYSITGHHIGSHVVSCLMSNVRINTYMFVLLLQCTVFVVGTWKWNDIVVRWRILDSSACVLVVITTSHLAFVNWGFRANRHESIGGSRGGTGPWPLKDSECTVCPPPPTGKFLTIKNNFLFSFLFFRIFFFNKVAEIWGEIRIWG